MHILESAALPDSALPSKADKGCAWHHQLQLSIESHDAQHLVCHKARSLQRTYLEAEQDKQYTAAVGAKKMLYELLLRRKMDHEAAKEGRPGWRYRHGKGKA